MKRLISGILVVVILVMTVVPAVAVRRDSLKAQFEWYLDREGRLILDASCSKGRIEEYYWEIWDDCDYLIESGYEKIWKTRIYQCNQTKRYSVTLIVTDRKGREDSVTERVTISPKYYREERIVISPRYLGRGKHRREIHLTREERALAWGIIFLAFIVKIIGDNN